MTARLAGAVLWLGVAAGAAPAAWHPLATWPDRGACERGRRQAIETRLRGHREAGTEGLVRLGDRGYTRIDARTLEPLTFLFACRPAAAGPPAS